MGNGGLAPPFLTLALDGCEWSVSRPGCFIPREIAAGTHWVGGWVGPRTGMNAVEKREYLDPTGNRTPAIKTVTYR
jgi:hypothetical protein